ncbi:MAG: FadR/GntR family transcriptional regulator [Acidimicrobiales bacterium]
MTTWGRDELGPVARVTVSSQVRQTLLDRIHGGQLPPGTRLPSEQYLSEQFQVARTSVREALQGLISQGIVERRGNRSYVAEWFPEVQLDAQAERVDHVRELFEARRALELPLIELAAQRINAAQRRQISQVAERFSLTTPFGEFRALDRVFHSTVVRACGNPLLLEIYDKVLNRLFDSQPVESVLVHPANGSDVGELIARSIAHHTMIAKAMARGDVDGAVSAASLHLDVVERTLIERVS